MSWTLVLFELREFINWFTYSCKEYIYCWIILISSYPTLLMTEDLNLSIHYSTIYSKSFLSMFILSKLSFLIESTLVNMFFGWFFSLNIYPIIYSSFPFMSCLSCFNVCILGNELLYLWTEICSPIHYEHSN